MVWSSNQEYMKEKDEKYIKIILDRLNKCKEYQPKFGTGSAVTLQDFKLMYGEDPFYSWFGLDNTALYAAHKAAGGITSLYRQIGLGSEELFRQVLQDELDLSTEQVAWSYEITTLTFKHNRKRGRYGWLRLTPAYSLKMVQRYLPDTQTSGKVFDPFCGTGTTPLYAAYQGLEAYALELNPFLVWFARVKTCNYEDDIIEELLEASKWILSQLDSNRAQPADPPPIRNIDRWWSKSALTFLRGIKGGIEAHRAQASFEKVIDLLYVCFCRTLIKISNAAFNHQSVSFDDSKQLSLFDETNRYKAIFSGDVKFVANSASYNPDVIPQIIQGDARNIDKYLFHEPVNWRGIDLVITSPPYPNRMSYIRELRPYI